MNPRALIVLGLVGGAGWLLWREVQASPAKATPAAPPPAPVLVASPPVSVVDLAPAAPPATAKEPPNPYARHMDFYNRQLPATPAAAPRATPKRSGLFTRLIAA